MSVTVWIDADACPRAVKEILFRAASRRKVMTWLVANHSMRTPNSMYVQSVQVPMGFDVADNHILQNAKSRDIVISADIPLAAELVNKGIVVINHRGQLYTEENIQERLSVRNFMQDLRDTGVQTGGPRSFSEVDKRNFASTFDRELTRKLQGR